MTAVMTALFTACPAPNASFSGGLLASMAKGLRRLAAQRQLALLDDRMLRDIGLDRSDVLSGRF